MNTSTPLLDGLQEPLNEDRIRYMMRLLESKLDNYHLTFGIMKGHNAPLDFNIFGSIKNKAGKSSAINVPANDMPDMVHKFIKYLEKL